MVIWNTGIFAHGRRGRRHRLHDDGTYDVRAIQKALGKFPLAQFTAQANPERPGDLVVAGSEGDPSAYREVHPYAELPHAIRIYRMMRTRAVVMNWRADDCVPGPVGY